MDLLEYENVKKLSYFQYCDYLQNKYGIGWYPYMTVSWNKNNRASRTTEGLVAHHKFEDRAIMLSHKEWAMKHPYEWQIPQNLIYCDYLEHLLLHILFLLQTNSLSFFNYFMSIFLCLSFRLYIHRKHRTRKRTSCRQTYRSIILFKLSNIIL